MQYYAPLKTASTKAFLVVKCIVMSQILTVIPSVELKKTLAKVYIYRPLYFRLESKVLRVSPQSVDGTFVI